MADTCIAAASLSTEVYTCCVVIGGARRVMQPLHHMVREAGRGYASETRREAPSHLISRG